MSRNRRILQKPTSVQFQDWSLSCTPTSGKCNKNYQSRPVWWPIQRRALRSNSSSSSEEEDTPMVVSPLDLPEPLSTTTTLVVPDLFFRQRINISATVTHHHRFSSPVQLQSEQNNFEIVKAYTIFAITIWYVFLLCAILLFLRCNR